MATRAREISGLEDEYRLAGDRPKLIYIKEGRDRERRLETLLEQIAKDRVSYRRFRDAAELGGLIGNDLAVLLTETFHLATNETSSRDGRLAQPRAPFPIPADRASIGVLPFSKLAEGSEADYFADGMVDDIITALSRFKSLTVITGLAMTLLLEERCEEAAELAAASASDYGDWGVTHLVLGAALAGSGRLEEAQAAVAELTHSLPELTISRHLSMLPIRDPERRSLLARYLHATALPEY